MKTREELIDEMAKAIYATGVALDGTDYAFGVYDDDDHFHRMASALIAANIGDVTAWKERAEKHRVLILPDGTIKQTYSNEEVEEIVRQRDEYKHRAEVAEKERDEYKHRAEVAERALATVCEEVLHARYPVEYVTVSVVEDFIQLTLKDAEKELAEEGGE